MKILIEPSSGRRGMDVYYRSSFGMASRPYCVPHDPSTPAQQHMREIFRVLAQAWGGKLSQSQRDLWNQDAPNVWSHARCGTRGKLFGEQFFEGINSVRMCCNLPPLWEPPARVIFQLSPVGELVLVTEEGRARLFLRLAATPTEDIMVFGQAPCSAGRSKRRNVSYLGLLPPPENGFCEITDLYKAKFGEPRPGRKIFIVTCQQKNGWKGIGQETNEIVPRSPAAQQPVPEAGALNETPPP